MARATPIISVAQARQQMAVASSPADAMRAQAQFIQAKRQLEIAQRLRGTDTIRAAALGVQVTECSGTIFVEGAGEVQPPPEVRFPVAFIERPIPGGTYELVENQAPEVGNMPTASIGVLRWITHKPDHVRTYWVGAVLGIVMTGRDEQLAYAHWNMRGRALRNPIGSSQEVS